MTKTKLTIELLREEAKKFSKVESQHDEPALFGVTDGKAVGTYLEHKFQAYLSLDGLVKSQNQLCCRYEPVLIT